MLPHTVFYNNTKSQKWYKKQVNSKLIHSYTILYLILIIPQVSLKLKTFHMCIQITFKFICKHIMVIYGVEIPNNILLMFIFINKLYQYSHILPQIQLVYYHLILAHLNAAKLLIYLQLITHREQFFNWFLINHILFCKLKR